MPNYGMERKQYEAARSRLAKRCTTPAAKRAGSWFNSEIGEALLRMYARLSHDRIMAHAQLAGISLGNRNKRSKEQLVAMLIAKKAVPPTWRQMDSTTISQALHNEATSSKGEAYTDPSLKQLAASPEARDILTPRSSSPEESLQPKELFKARVKDDGSDASPSERLAKAYEELREAKEQVERSSKKDSWKEAVAQSLKSAVAEMARVEIEKLLGNNERQDTSTQVRELVDMCDQELTNSDKSKAKRKVRFSPETKNGSKQDGIVSLDVDTGCASGITLLTADQLDSSKAYKVVNTPHGPLFQEVSVPQAAAKKSKASKNAIKVDSDSSEDEFDDDKKRRKILQ